MFTKVLIAEDHEIENLGVINTLKDLEITDFTFVSYCDEAYNRIDQAIKDQNAFQLLITDLGFIRDHRNERLTTGQELIREALALQPDLKIIAFSIEKRPAVIDELFKVYHIDGFVSKGRNDGKELISTIKKVFAGEKVLPQHLLTAIRNTTQNITPYDISLLKLLAEGRKQKEIVQHFADLGIKPDSRSAIEKRLNDLREILDAKNNIEMIVLCKDLGIL